MIPIGPNADGVMTFKMSGMFAEVFDNLQVCYKISLKTRIIRKRPIKYCVINRLG